MTPTKLKYKIYCNENIKSWGKVTNLVNLSTVFLMLTVVIRFDVFLKKYVLCFCQKIFYGQ